MKDKIIAAMLCSIIIGVSLLSGCGASNSSSSEDASPAATNEPPTATNEPSTSNDDSPTADGDLSVSKDNATNNGITDALSQIEDIIDSNADDPQMPSINDIPKSDPVTIDDVETYFTTATPVEIGKTIHADGIANFTFSDVYWSKTVEPRKPEGSYYYLDEVEGCKYFVLEGTFENLQDNEIDIDGESLLNVFPYVAIVSYEGDYYVVSLMAAEEDDSSLNVSGKVGPNQKVTVYMTMSMPDDACKTGASADILFGFSDLQEDIYDNSFGGTTIHWDDCSSLYKLEVTEIKDKVAANN